MKRRKDLQQHMNSGITIWPAKKFKTTRISCIKKTENLQLIRFSKKNGFARLETNVQF